MLENILKKSGTRFYWSKFEKEFLNKLEIQSRTDFRTFEFGVNNISFLVESRNFDSFFDEVKEFVGKFSYWKYFDESEGVLAKIISPKVTMIPLSAYAYLKAIHTSSI